MARKKAPDVEPALAERPYAEIDGVRVNPRLVEHLVPVRDLVLDPANARTHSERNLKAVESSLKRFGFQLPVLYDPETMHVVAGNGRLQVASERLGWAKVPAIPFRGTPEELSAYAIMDNRTAELAEWDWQRLGENLRPLLEGDLFTGEEMGFDAYELAPILGADWSPGEPDDSETFEHEETHVVKFSHPQWLEIERALARRKKEGGISDASSVLTELARAYAGSND